MAESDTTPQLADPEPTASDDETATGTEQAPWAREGIEFDADKAWKLVLNLREENKGLKEKNRAYEDEKLSEKEKADRDLAETRAQIEQLRMEKTRVIGQKVCKGLVVVECVPVDADPVAQWQAVRVA
ncbi:hypothetical protein [Bifidobacterium cuniculi]|uniref:Uncharacterized protein n=1 Tax=Bifidobacterium cuniculi TaxID=1688 RepID=A0A087AT65_9BIFI|nr:hypothetical protein [Bifidobacterium cuniculi]KFI61965.1 hypothetical protein BCUN_1807 [Bifidobacterium cuniculi]